MTEHRDWDEPHRRTGALLVLAAQLVYGFATLSSAAAAPIAPPAGNGPHLFTVESSDVSIYFDHRSDAATNDPNRIDLIYWSGFYASQYAAAEPRGGPAHCGDPDEYFGQALGYPDATTAPAMVASGQRGSWTSKLSRNRQTNVAETYTSVSPCKGVTLSGLTRTRYKIGEGMQSAVKIQRTFRFNPGLGVVTNTGLRAYIPRVPLQLHYVLVPNSQGAVVTYDARKCAATPCTVTDWNGTWFADDFGEGAGLVIFRDPSSTAPAFIGIQSGGSANSNFSSIVLAQPANGWSGVVTETEYLCPYDQNSWTPGSGRLPAYCVIEQSPTAEE